ncbi:tripartite motif-containing protein 2-like [Daphnia pulicaria]|uniref:tripartite motif-containing protein 2-like n=1 Tax=Daphnia pulicaria TaxID=35523 RepID=UPI001EEC3C10|nr:tripartite motif-containing protein 2-like [Daphnia pulicaria]XP_046644058.1 tripartite motif-containing protein 2-like [Daphnia pulicaria]XP_046644059.1 tripartite motif-containing protein 2-like [Daphnia pulicaria]XP_046644060.1 tripartite motif-containing protein 2-like [Daphnia pulicaria]
MIQDPLTVELSGKLLENTKSGIVGQKYSIIITIKNSPSDHPHIEHGIQVPCVTVRGPLREYSRLYEEDTPGIQLTDFPQPENSGNNSCNSINLMSCPLHHLVNNGSKGSLRPRSAIANKQLPKPVLQITFTVRQVGDCIFETVLSFPQIGRYEIQVVLENSIPIIADGPLKVDIFHPSIRKKSLGDLLRSSSPQASLKDVPLEDSVDLISRIGCRGRAKGQFSNPQDIVAFPGRILATDSNNQCVQVFNVKKNDNDLQFGCLGRLAIDRGRLLGQIQRPTGIASMPEKDQFIVADYENRWMSVFEMKGKFVSRFGMGKLQGPKGVAVDGKGKIYVVDNKASAICVFSTNGRFVGRFGSRGVGEDHLAGPHFIGINSFGHSVVSDFHNHAVKVFDSTGQYLYSFGCNGEEDGQFNAPTGVAIDPFDNILVGDWGNSRVQVFDRQGTFLQCINTSSDPLYGPQGLSLCDGMLYVADSGNHCIKVYRYDNFVTNVLQVE